MKEHKMIGKGSLVTVRYYAADLPTFILKEISNCILVQTRRDPFNRDEFMCEVLPQVKGKNVYKATDTIWVSESQVTKQEEG
jgi:hypothetical protein